MWLTQKDHSIIGMSLRKYHRFDLGVARGDLRKQDQPPNNKVPVC